MSISSGSMHFAKVEILSIRVNKKSFATHGFNANLFAIADGILHPVTDDIKEALLSDPDVFLIVTKYSIPLLQRKREYSFL
jgi:hypothetical protein